MLADPYAFVTAFLGCFITKPFRCPAIGAHYGNNVPFSAFVAAISAAEISPVVVMS